MTKDFTQQNIDSWLNGNFDADTKKEISRMQAEDPAALSDAFYRTLEFGTGGMRGILGVGTNRMNKYTVGFATQGLANYLIKCCKQNIKVAISFDSRNFSTEFATISANILAANGIQVFLFDSLRPTPELSFAVRHLQCNAGIMIPHHTTRKNTTVTRFIGTTADSLFHPTTKMSLPRSTRSNRLIK